MWNRLAWLIASLVLATTGSAQTQMPLPLAANSPARFESWQPSVPIHDGSNPAVGQFSVSARDRKRHALIGGAVGALAGVAFCTVVASLVDEKTDRLSTCPVDTLLLFGAGGFALGFALGWVI